MKEGRREEDVIHRGKRKKEGGVRRRGEGGGRGGGRARGRRR